MDIKLNIYKRRELLFLLSLSFYLVSLFLFQCSFNRLFRECFHNFVTLDIWDEVRRLRFDFQKTFRNRRKNIEIYQIFLSG